MAVAFWLTVCPVISGRLLEPQMVKLKGKVHFIDAFCGAYLTFALSKEGHVYGFGLSNYHQLGKYGSALITSIEICLL